MQTKSIYKKYNYNYNIKKYNITILLKSSVLVRIIRILDDENG